MNTVLLALSLLFLGLFVAYLVAETNEIRRKVGLGLILSLVFVCCYSLFVPIAGKSKGGDTWPINIRPGIDIKGGTQFIIQLDGEPTAASLDQAVEQIRKRIDDSGVAEPIIQPLGTNRILVQIPGISEEEKAGYRQRLEQVAKLEFKTVDPQNDSLTPQIVAGTAQVPFDSELLDYVVRGKDGKEITHKILVKRRSEMSGKTVKEAFRSVGQMNAPVVAIEFTSEGARQFEKLTGDMADHLRQTGQKMQLAVVLDGVVRSAPGVEKAITGGSCVIEGGNMTALEAQQLASVLENPLENPVKVIDERGVDPSLGASSINAGFHAAIIGFVAVVLFMMFYYRLAGVFAVIALLLNLVVLLGLLAQFGFTLTMPGVAGIILTIGISVDANVLLFERMNEEWKSGKPLEASVRAGFDKAFSSIIDANMTTLIAAVIMFWKGTGAIQGFAIVLCLGILSSLFAALVITRTCFDWALAEKVIKELRMVRILHGTKIDFMALRWPAAILSILLFVAGAVNWGVQGEKVLGVDFTGGDLLTMSFAHKVPEDSIHQLLGGDVHVQYQRTRTLGNAEEILSIRTGFGKGEEAEATLEKAFPDAGFKRNALDKVQAQIGNEFRQQALISIVLGAIGIFFYIMWRFEASYAVGALVALLHDIVITLGIFSLFGREFSLVAVGAILTIAGYSINDTIVVFDRIRETLKSGYKGHIAQAMNDAINATLSRTLLTSGTTLIAVTALFLFGGIGINDFAFVLVVGILVGTYSSIFIASPIVLAIARMRRQRHSEEVPVVAAPVR